MKHADPQQGFTLIEMIIAVGIFVLVLQLVAGAYGRFVRIEREGIGQQEMQEDVRLFLQLFNREARTAFGNTYLPVTNPHPGIVFRNQENNCVYYYLDQTLSAVFRTEVTTPDDSDPCADGTGAMYTGPHRRLTDLRNTMVERLNFEAIAAQPEFPALDPLTRQGMIIVYMTIRSNEPTAERMNLQSTVTSRQFIPYPHVP